MRKSGSITPLQTSKHRSPRSRSRSNEPSQVLLTAAAAAVLAAGFDLSAIASIGSAIALLVFALVSIGHIRVHADTGAKPSLLWVAVLSTLAVLVTFVFTTLIHEPASLVTLFVILALSVALDIGWKHSRETAKVKETL